MLRLVVKSIISFGHPFLEDGNYEETLKEQPDLKRLYRLVNDNDTAGSIIFCLKQFINDQDPFEQAHNDRMMDALDTSILLWPLLLQLTVKDREECGDYIKLEQGVFVLRNHIRQLMTKSHDLVGREDFQLVQEAEINNRDQLFLDGHQNPHQSVHQTRKHKTLVGVAALFLQGMAQVKMPVAHSIY